MTAPSTAHADEARDYLHETLVRDFAVELLDDLRSLSVSSAEALYRQNIPLARMHFDQIQLVGRELSVAFKDLKDDTN